MSVIINENEFDSGHEAAYLNMAFRADFEMNIGNRDFNVIKCYFLHLGEAAQKIVGLPDGNILKEGKHKPAVPTMSFCTSLWRVLWA